MLVAVPSKLNFSLGNKGVRKSKGTRSRMYSGVRPLIYLILTRGICRLPSGTDLGHRVAGFQRVVLDLALAHVDVVRRVQIIVIGRTQEAVAVRHDFQDPGCYHGSFEFDFGSLGLLLLGNAVARMLFIESVFLLLGVGPVVRGGRVVLQVVEQLVDEFLAVDDGLRGLP